MSNLIPNEFIDELLAKTDIADVIGPRVELTRKGKEYTGLCPFHAEKTPSFTVNTIKQFYYCFGCKRSGNSIGFIMNFETVPFREAIDILAELVGLDVSENKPTEFEKSTMAISTVLGKSEQYYKSQYSDVDTPDTFLGKCGINELTRVRYSVGYASKEAAQYIHTLTRKSVIEAGLATETKNALKHWSTNKLILGVRDRRGTVRGFISQPMSATAPKASAKTALFNHEHELFGLHEAHDVIRQTDTIVVVERPLEVLALHSHGIQCAVSTINNPISKKTLDSLFKLVSNVVFCFSRTRIREDIFSITLKLSLSTLKEGRDISFVILPTKYRNCASFLVSNNGDAFHELVDTATPTVDILYKKLSSNKDYSGAEKDEWVMREGLVALSTVPSSLYRRLSIRRFEALCDT